MNESKWAPPGTRGVRLATTPSASVVVASFREPALLEACLASLRPQCAAKDAQLIIARACEAPELEAFQRRYPATEFILCEPGTSIPRLRAAGMAAATGDIVALTEDHCVAAPDWLDRLLDAQARSNTDVVGGSMDNARRDRSVDWAAYFSEYGFFAEQGGAGEQPLLTGANVAYRRDLVDEVTAQAGAGEWENVVHARLLERGRAFAFVRDAAIYQNQRYTFGAFCRDRYEHGRDYARRRLATQGNGRRWVYFFGSAVLPAILILRISRVIGAGQRLAFLRALPLTFGFLTAWSVGEAVGYLRGPTGPAAEAAASEGVGG